MKRLHVHVAVEDLSQAIRFYSTLFAADPAVVKDDYAKWMLDDPRVNFAISMRGRKVGLDHLGIQVETADELEEVFGRLHKAERPILEVATPSAATRSPRSPGSTILPASRGRPFAPRERAPSMANPPSGLTA